MINIKRHSGIYTLVAKQELPISIEEAWNFFSSPINLAKVSPPSMKFKVTSQPSEELYPGQIITHKVALLPGISINWITEITHVKKYNYFIDEQRFGLYTMWHHEHRFKEMNQGVSIIDQISYKVPLGVLGRLIHLFVIKQQLINVFEFRFKALNNLFSHGRK